MTPSSPARWTAIGLIVLATADGAVALASDGHTAAVPTSTNAAATRVPWIVLETGHAARSLVIRYKSVACPDGPGRAQLHESSKQVAITVAQKAEHVLPSRPCIRMALITRLVVRLRRPIAGRRIAGDGYPWRLPPGSVDYLAKPMPDPPHPAIELPLVPHVIGLSPSEATAVLRREGFHVQLTGARTGEITAQDPVRGRLAPGSTRQAPYNGRVTLTVGA